jgi:hypothetical protein
MGACATLIDSLRQATARCAIQMLAVDCFRWAQDSLQRFRRLEHLRRDDG